MYGLNTSLDNAKRELMWGWQDVVTLHRLQHRKERKQNSKEEVKAMNLMK